MEGIPQQYDLAITAFAIGFPISLCVSLLVGAVHMWRKNLRGE